MDEGLLEQGVGGQELADLAFDHLFDDLGGLAGLGGLFGGESAFLLDQLGRDIVGRQAHRVGEGDMLADLRQQIVVGLAVNGHHHANLVVVVHVGAHAVAGDLQTTSEAHVFADLGEAVLDASGDVGGGFDHAGVGGNGHVGDGVGHCLELIVSAAEVGLAAELDHRGALAVIGQADADEAFRGASLGLLLGLDGASLAEQVLGGFHVPVGLLEGLLAFHHALAGFIAKGLDHCCSNFSHDIFQMLLIGYRAGGRRMKRLFERLKRRISRPFLRV